MRTRKFKVSRRSRHYLQDRVFVNCCPEIYPNVFITFLVIRCSWMCLVCFAPSLTGEFVSCLARKRSSEWKVRRSQRRKLHMDLAIASRRGMGKCAMEATLRAGFLTMSRCGHRAMHDQRHRASPRCDKRLRYIAFGRRGSNNHWSLRTGESRVIQAMPLQRKTRTPVPICRRSRRIGLLDVDTGIKQSLSSNLRRCLTIL